MNDLSNRLDSSTLSLSSNAQHKLVHVPEGAYYKVSENSRALIREPTMGLVVNRRPSKSGRGACNVVLVCGELILVPEGDCNA